MLRVDQVHVIRHNMLVQGRTQRAVARELGISRVTVRKYLDQAVPARDETRPRGRPVWDVVGARVEALLDESRHWTGATCARDAHTFLCYGPFSWLGREGRTSMIAGRSFSVPNHAALTNQLRNRPEHPANSLRFASFVRPVGRASRARPTRARSSVTRRIPASQPTLPVDAPPPDSGAANRATERRLEAATSIPSTPVVAGPYSRVRRSSPASLTNAAGEITSEESCCGTR